MGSPSHWEGSSEIQDENLDMKRFCEELTVKLEEVLESDDETALLKLLGDYGTAVETINCLVNDCVEFGATKCLIALIRGKVNPMSPLFDAEKLPQSGVTPLAYVAHTCPADPYLINLMFVNCGAACHANLSCTIGSVCGLPIHFLLINLSLTEYLHTWYRGTSVVKLVILLCLWETKPIIDSLRVLVNYTDSINDVAWTILKNGGLKQFAALLLIARAKVLAPFGTGLTIHHYISSEIEEIESSIEGKLSIEQEELKCILKDAQTLLALFERAGDALSLYCSSIQKNIPVDEVVVSICTLLFRNQVNVTEFDINIHHKEYYRSASVWSMLMNECKPTNFTPEAAPPTGLEEHFIYDRPWIVKIMPIPKLACVQARLYTTRACPATKMGDCQLFHKMKSGSMLNLAPPNSTPHPFLTINGGGPRKHLTYIASRLARWIKL